MDVFLFLETLIDRRRHRRSPAIVGYWVTDADRAVLKRWITANTCVAEASENTYPAESIARWRVAPAETNRTGPSVVGIFRLWKLAGLYLTIFLEYSFLGFRE